MSRLSLEPFVRGLGNGASYLTHWQKSYKGKSNETETPISA